MVYPYLYSLEVCSPAVITQTSSYRALKIFNQESVFSITLPQAYGCVDDDGSRYLLGDYLGNLYLLVLQHDGSRVLG